MASKKSQHSLVGLDEKLHLLRTPEPPYYVAISTNIHCGRDLDDYNILLDRMLAEVDQVEGYLGMDNAKEILDDGLVYSLSAIYFSNMESLEVWRNHRKHVAVKAGAKKRWFTEHNIRICQVLEHYGSNLTHT